MNWSRRRCGAVGNGQQESNATHPRQWLTPVCVVVKYLGRKKWLDDAPITYLYRN